MATWNGLEPSTSSV